MFDTHCHLNFSAFKKNLNEVIDDAKKAGVNYFVVPGTDYESSKRAVEIAEKYEGIYAAVGIHPHHVYEMYQKARYRVSRPPHPKGAQAIDSKQVSSLLPLLSSKKVVAIGEIGIDRHIYQKTKYKNYQIDEDFINMQKIFFLEQIKLANRYKKALIIHNREDHLRRGYDSQAKNDLLQILTADSYLLTPISAVFHCCEPDQQLLDFAIKYNVFIGVDGDVTYNRKKQEFVKKIPLELLVLETDSPFLLPEPLRSQKKFLPAGRQVPNEPKNLAVIAEYIAGIKQIPVDQLTGITTENARRLFELNKDQ